MNFKKSLAVLSVAGILSMGIVNCGGVADLTILKSGTYDCIDEEKEKSIFVFDTSKNTWDYIKDGKLSDVLKSSGGVLVLGKRDESTKSYELSINSEGVSVAIGVLSVNGTKFSSYNITAGRTEINTCIKR
jgi:hypothetical protein